MPPTPTIITILRIRGMHAVHAVRAVETALGGLVGVSRAEVTLGEAKVEHDRELTVESLVDAIVVAGFDVEGWRQERRRLPTV